MNNNLTVPLSGRLVSVVGSGTCVFEHRFNYAKQALTKPQLAIAGGYHFGNLGDMALGNSVKRQAIEIGVKSQLQTIYNLDRWPKAESLIVGGGAVAYSEPLNKLRTVYKEQPARVALIGVDFNDPDAVIESKEFLQQVALITCRSSEQAQFLREVLDRSDIGWHYDLCFSYFDHSIVTRTVKRQPVFGINCVPFFYNDSNHEFTPGTKYIDELRRNSPDLLPYVNEIGFKYCEMMRAVVKSAQQQGFQVVHFPFTPSDDVFARTIFSGLNISYRKYTSNILNLLPGLQQCDRFFTTRFHSLVFSIVTRTPFIPFNYATKCERLLTDLEVDAGSQINVRDLLEDTSKLADKISGIVPIKIPEEKVSEIGASVADWIRLSIKKTQ
jgi:hypothetical protein